MSTSKEFLEHVLEVLDNSPEIFLRPMMGEYLLYYSGKLVGGIYDNCLLLKNVQAIKNLLPDAKFRLPYNGATKPMVLVENVDDGEFLKSLFAAIYDELPEPKNKEKGSKKT